MIEHISSLEDYLFEIGDAGAKPFKWELTDHRPTYAYYRATSWKSGIEYNILFDGGTGPTGKNKFNLSFTADAPEDMDDDYSPFTVILNAGDMFGLMSTIIEVCANFIEKFDPEMIFFTGSPDKKPTVGAELNKRTKLYLAFLNKNISKISPDAKVSMSGGTVTITLKS